MKILMVLTSHDRLGDTGRKTGFWLEEFAAPYYVFKDSGAELTLASPAGGQPPLDPVSAESDAQTDATRRFDADADAQELLASTVKLAGVSQDDFDAVFYPGGHGPLWDLAQDADSIALLESFDRAGKPLALVCHAPAALRQVKGADGDPLIKGRKVTGFSNGEEAGVELTDVVPFLIEDEFQRLGALYECGEDWGVHVVTDGTLITGQNPASSGPAAEALVAKLKA
jgi:putative intracellular protease/amidase